MQSRDRRNFTASTYKEIVKGMRIIPTKDWTRLANMIVGKNPTITKTLQSMLLFDTTRRLDFIELNELLRKCCFEETYQLSKTLNLKPQVEI
jgi:hypothetical protein